MKAKVYLSWGPSPSVDVQSVNVVVTNDMGLPELNMDVTPDVTSLEVGMFDEKTSLHATVVTFDGTNHSDPVTSSFMVPDLSKPMPVQNLGWTYEVVEDVEV